MFTVSADPDRDLAPLANALGALGDDATKVIQRAVARSGDMGRTAVIRALAKQTGLPQKTIRRALKIKRPNYDDLTYTIRAGGGDISLKYFKARETRKGVVAYVRGGKELYEGAFIRGGNFQRGRVDLSMGGQIFKRMGDDRLPIERLTSGLFIGQEMITGDTADAWQRTIDEALPRRLRHEIDRALPG